jgi:hypothetical protein
VRVSQRTRRILQIVTGLRDDKSTQKQAEKEQENEGEKSSDEEEEDTVLCFLCNQPGHYATYCPLRFKKRGASIDNNRRKFSPYYKQFKGKQPKYGGKCKQI